MGWGWATPAICDLDCRWVARSICWSVQLFLCAPVGPFGGWSSCCGYWWAVSDGVVPQRKPGLRPGPVGGQVQDGSALGPDESSGDVDDPAAQRGYAGAGVVGTGQDAGSPQQVVGDRRAQHPGGVGAEAA